MKKTILTLSFLALFAVVSKAQQATTQPAAASTEAKTVVNSDGTISTVTTNATPAATTKKSGTRMAINEKGLPGGTTKKEATKEEKSTTAPAQPAAGTKKN